MSGVSYFPNASNFKAKNTTFNLNTSNTYVSDGDARQYLHKHSATSAMHDSEERYPPPLCHPGTREVVICRIEGWYGFEKPPEKKIMWVHGPAGYGKTAVAGTVSYKMEDKTTDLGFNPVGATFFFWRASPARNSPKHFIITLAYQFTISIPELAPHIEAAVKRNPMVLNKALEVQLTKLIVEPFKSLGELDAMPHRLVIVDGLDECINSDQESRVPKQYAEDQERVQVRVLELIRTLHSHNLPLCFLILSRPELWIKQHIESRSLKSITETLDLYETGDHMNDVEKYVRDEFSRIAEALDDGSGDDGKWPGEHLFQRFLSRTQGHMLYATTVIRHIDDPYDDPRQRLQDILSNEFNSTPDLAHSTPFSSLHELYRQILLACPRANRATMVEVLEEMLIFGTPFLAFPTWLPPSLNLLDCISERVPGRGIKGVRPLHAVVRLPDNRGEFTEEGFFYHLSFAEFLKAEHPLLPDVALNLQKGVRRLLGGCFKSLSAIALDTPSNTELCDLSLKYWPALWYRWNPGEDADPSSIIKALLAVDLTAHYVRIMTGQSPRVVALHLCVSGLYHPTDNVITCCKPYSVCGSLLEEAMTHLRTSVERVILHVLNPDNFATVWQYQPHFGLSVELFNYFSQVYEHRLPAFDDVVRALACLLEKHEEISGELEREVLDRCLKRERPAIESMFKLARQIDKS